MNDLEAPYKEPEEEDVYYCPCCGEECEEFFTANGKILGCENCVRPVDAWEWEADYEDDY